MLIPIQRVMSETYTRESKIVFSVNKYQFVHVGLIHTSQTHAFACSTVRALDLCVLTECILDVQFGHRRTTTQPNTHIENLFCMYRIFNVR